MLPMISSSARTVSRSSCLFSILIPTWNNLPYLQCCIRSIRKHSAFPHQIIVHINEGTDGTLDWIKAQPDVDYTYSSQNIGVCFALNAARALVQTDYIVYLNDDMYVPAGIVYSGKKSSNFQTNISFYRPRLSSRRLQVHVPFKRISVRIPNIFGKMHF